MNTSEDEPVDWDMLRKLAMRISDKDYNALVDDYRHRVHQAHMFAGIENFDDGLYLLGLTLNQLELIPPGSLIDIEPHWARAPLSVHRLWETGSIIVPANL
ncbi:hypothetical protein C121_56 [Stenotrophomonas phage C121]|uniref:hypothetical protein n=1 Tax=Stenotrophomonas phage C121 TaxID=2914029 RepID=UPI0023296E02|nr:hypothetical protein PP752_gp56 [Stenotrophomonas phage C121]UKL14789.1 hypothetical protein C121_56 [Stenotrophomonas phage C121]